MFNKNELQLMLSALNCKLIVLEEYLNINKDSITNEEYTLSFAQKQEIKNLLTKLDKYNCENQYKFKISDEVGYSSGKWIYSNSKNVIVHEVNIEFINEHRKDFVLVCKAENKENK